MTLEHGKHARENAWLKTKLEKTPKRNKNEVDCEENKAK